jgi:hypothetical protein
MKRILGVLIVVGAVFLTGSSCGGDGPTDTGPGTLIVRLTAPASNADSAIRITITGPTAPTGATAGTGLRLFQSSINATTTRYALTGLLGNGATILTIDVADVSAFAQYSGTVDAVSRANYQLRSLSGYAIALTR